MIHFTSFIVFIVVLLTIDVRYSSSKVRKNMKRTLCVYYGWEECFSCNKSFSCFDNNDCLFSKNIGLKIPAKPSHEYIIPRITSMFFGILNKNSFQV